jgi:hypothetical protein
MAKKSVTKKKGGKVKKVSVRKLRPEVKRVLKKVSTGKSDKARSLKKQLTTLYQAIDCGQTLVIDIS